MLLETLAPRFKKVRSTNSTDSSFASRVPTLTEPTGEGVIDLVQEGGSCVQNNCQLVFFGTDANNETFNARVIGWRRVGQGVTTLWVPVILGQFGCTLGNIPGVATTPVDESQFLVDTITITTGNDDFSMEAISPTGDVIGHVVLDIKGFEKIELTFSLGTGASGNALLAMY